MAITNSFLGFLKKKLEYVIALLVFVFFFAISITQTGVKMEYSMYDTLLHIKPAVSERNDILLVNIDDEAIEQIGAFPWTRDVIADALIRLREAGGKTIVFDIEYMTPGQTGVNRSYVKDVFPAEYASVHSEILQYLKDFSEAVSSKNIPLSEVSAVGTDMSTYIDQQMNDLSGSISANIFRDNDEYFANAIKFFGNTYLTINYLRINIKEETKTLDAYAREHILLTNVQDPQGFIVKEHKKRVKNSDFEMGIAPAIYPLISQARGGGFPNVAIDEDGVRRRIPMLVEYEGAYVAQLVFAPILDILQPELIIRNRYTFVLKNALIPSDLSSGKRKDIVLPLDEEGSFLINWLKKDFADAKNPENRSFRQISVYALRVCDEIEEKLISNLESIKSIGIKNSSGYLSYHDAVVWLLSSYHDLSIWKQELLLQKKTDYDAYFVARKEFFTNYEEFLNGDFDTEIYTIFDNYYEKTNDSRYAETSEKIRKNFDLYRSDLKIYQTHFEKLVAQSAGSFCIIGWSGVGTSDLGVNPFAESYANIGTHANIYNTIMTGEFIHPLPIWASWLVAFLLCYGSALAFRRIKSLKGRIVYGVVSSILVFALIAALFSFFRVYVQMFVPLFSVVVTFVLVSIFKFVFSEQEKSFLRKAFTMYLSSDVVNEIVADPSKLKLGGQEKNITALFTDIKSFSSLSEKVTPEHLVQILNKYLTVMSDIVLEQKGTIDKYIGDAIVSFFGAPLDLPDHASRACLAAIRMTQAEVQLNKEFLASGDVPMAIHTRIGVNSGPMVVGNMGTDNKMNYTIMGNDVNLAARLEGVNKSYATWILVSETTWKQTDGQFLGRKLDRVRVVGIDTPVQLYNLLAVVAEAPPAMVSLVGKFNEAIDAYHAKRFADALALFTKCLEIDPDDGASAIFRDRVAELLKVGVAEDWTDVVNMTSK